MSDFNNLIGKKFRRNVYGLSSWTDVISEVGYSTHILNRTSKEIKPYVVGTQSKIRYDLNEIVLVVEKLHQLDELKLSKREFHEGIRKGIRNTNPKYLYRPSDYSIFQITDDGTYTHQDNINREWVGHKYSYETLIGHNFVPCTEDDFDWLKEKRELYYEYVAWASRSDGHGGSKGGTFEEFLEIKNREKK